MLVESWVESANQADNDFPLNNLPCAVFSHGGADPRCGMAIGHAQGDSYRIGFGDCTATVISALADP